MLTMTKVPSKRRLMVYAAGAGRLLLLCVFLIWALLSSCFVLFDYKSTDNSSRHFRTISSRPFGWMKTLS